jgi:hypothetical protein
LQSILNSDPNFVIWGEHNGFLRHIADAYYAIDNSLVRNRMSDGVASTGEERLARLRDLSFWPAWANPLSQEQLLDQFRYFIRQVFDRDRPDCRWGFKEIRYPRKRTDKTLEFLHACFPGAQFLIIVRNPFDTLFSVMLAWFRTLETNEGRVDLVLRWFMRQWSRKYEQLFLFHHSTRRSLIVKYEDLIETRDVTAIESFLQVPAPFPCGPVFDAVRGAAVKDDDFARLVRRHMDATHEELARISRRTRLLYGYDE